jgi:hypothetical protein
MTVTYPIIAPEFNDDLDPEWAGDITEAINDFQTRISALEGGLPTVAYKDTNETVNNTAVIQNDDELVLAVAASTKYFFELYVPYNSGATPDLKVGWTLPSGATNIWQIDYFDTSAVAQKGQSSSVPTTGFAIGGFGADLYVRFLGSISISSTAGNMQVVWAQNTANASNSTVYAGAFLSITPVPV